MKKSFNYQDYLLTSLQDPEEAAGYLNAALESGNLEGFLLALKNVITAAGGMAMLAEKTHKSRTSLYKTLSAHGNPYLYSTNEILQAVGLHLMIAPKVSRRSQTKRPKPVTRKIP